jgi:hypothetical protein
VNRPVSPRDRAAGWGASALGMAIVVTMTLAVVAVGWLLAVAISAFAS